MAKNAIAKLWSLPLRSDGTRYSKPPIVPPTLSAVAASASQINVTASGASSGLGSIVGFLWYRNGQLLSSTPSTSPLAATGLLPSTLYSFTAVAVDSAGNQSAISTAATATTAASADATPPSTPASINVSVVSSTSLQVAWSASTDTGGSGLAGYIVERSLNGTSGWTALPATSALTLTDTGLTANTRYYYRVKAYDNASNTSTPSSVSNAVTASTGGSGEADWQARISAPGVLWAQRFQAVSDVSNYTGGVPYAPANQQFIPGAGIIPGDGALRQSVLANTDGGGRWGRPMQPMPGDINQPGVATRPRVATTQSWNEPNAYIMNPAYAGVAHGSPPRSGTSIGSEFYFQFRVKFSTGRITDAGAVGGKMLMFETNYNNPTQELVLRSKSATLGPVPQVYTSQGSLFNSALQSPQDAGGGGTTNKRQPGGTYVIPSGTYSGQTVDAACTYTNGVSGCWQWPEGEWVTVLVHFKPGLQAINTSNVLNSANDPVRNTQVRIWVATEADIAAGTGYRLIHSKNDYVWLYDDAAQINASGGLHAYGLNWLNLNFFTGGGSFVQSTIDWYHQFDQLIFSLQPIACPTVPSVPSYIASMAPYQVRNLSGTYAPSNGSSTLRNSVTGTWATDDDVMRPWSGGAKSLSDTKMWVHGGGHSDSANNSLPYFDFAGDTKPIGWGIGNIGQTNVTTDFAVGTTGIPISVHTYDDMCDMGANLYRFSGSAHPNGNFTNQVVRFNKAAATWTRLPNYPAGGGVGMCAANPVAGKVLVMDRWTGFFTYAFYREATNDWGATKTVPAQWPDYSVFAFDPVTNTYLCVAGNKAFSGSIDWTNETMTQTARTINGIAAASALIWDPTRRCYWAFGGGSNTGTLYEINPTTFAVTAHTLTGDVPLAPESGTIGVFGRFVFMDSYRAIGTVMSRTGAALVIRLPS